MMDRAEKAGLGMALAGHGVLLALLSAGFASVRKPPGTTDPIEVSIVDETALRSAAPSTAAPAPSIAPALGAPEEPAPAAIVEPLAPAAEPEPVAPPPAPKLVPKPALPPPVPAKAAARPAPAPAKSAPAKAPAATPGKVPAAAARGSLLGKDFLKGIGRDPAPAKTAVASGAVMSAIALAGIKSAIQRQIQPCADRQVNPGPGANQIQVTLNLRLNRDGSLAQRPNVVRTTGVNDENNRYEKRVTDLAVATYTGCAPLRGLPDDLYQTAKGGWSNINMNYKLPG